jgi:hypothetical protein
LVILNEIQVTRSSKFFYEDLCNTIHLTPRLYIPPPDPPPELLPPVFPAVVVVFA